MIDIAMKTNSTMNHDSILSLNISNPQSVKNKNNITAIVKSQTGQPQQSTAQIRQPQQPTAQIRRPQQPTAQIRQPQQPTAQIRRSQQSTAQISQPAMTAGQQNTTNITSIPVAKPLPTLENKVQKGQKAPLSSAPLTTIDACFGWNVTDARCDVDVSAFLLGADGKVIGDSWFIFYGQKSSPDQSTKFITSIASDREIIQIDFARLNPDVRKIVFVLTINEALANKLNFGMLKDAYVRIMDKSGSELVSFMMTEYYNNVISMMICELYQHNGMWKFNAVGNGVAKDLAGLCTLYGVEII